MPADRPESHLPLTPLWFNILLALADESRHGYAILKEIERRTEGQMRPATGTVYLALQRLEEDRLIAEATGKKTPTDKRRRRWYRLTPFGRLVMKAEAERLALQVRVALSKHVIDSTAFEGRS